jgi:uncharacterized membrane protein
MGSGVRACELTANAWESSGAVAVDAPANASGTDRWTFVSPVALDRKIVATHPLCTNIALTLSGTYSTTGGSVLAYNLTSCNDSGAPCPVWNCTSLLNQNATTTYTFVDGCASLCLGASSTNCTVLRGLIYDKCNPDPEEAANQNEIYVGIFVAICGNMLISVALNVQKFSHNKNNAAKQKKSYLLRPTWWLGMALMGLGEIGNFLAYAFAPASVVAPLGTVALVSNAIIAPVVLKERFRLQDLIGIIIAIGGAVVVVRARPARLCVCLCACLSLSLSVHTRMCACVVQSLLR